MNPKYESVCVADFCGSFTVRGHHIYPFQYWAFWWPAKRITQFGGRWYSIPDMPGSQEPTESAVFNWAKENGGLYFTPEEQKLLNFLQAS